MDSWIYILKDLIISPFDQESMAIFGVASFYLFSITGTLNLKKALSFLFHILFRLLLVDLIVRRYAAFAIDP